MSAQRTWVRDKRLNIYHLILLLTIFNRWKAENERGNITISRRQMMKATLIASITTYHKYMNDLVQFGYIIYQPSYHPRNATVVRLVVI
ncbi:hypothetical protein EG028_19690 [Chitinophaga barathri]|uniref:Uncharacterized protein n=1 Tax=Chitinophaga barathri TaxID=1647451 RepID=A0A3N4MGX9_9BACT|nr:hypothetical protein EG028_19690 [Chitinophaga barathri]